MGLFHLPCCHTSTPSSLLHSSFSLNPPVVPNFLPLPFAYLAGSFISGCTNDSLEELESTFIGFAPRVLGTLEDLYNVNSSMPKRSPRLSGRNTKIFQKGNLIFEVIFCDSLGEIYCNIYIYEKKIKNIYTIHKKKSFWRAQVLHKPLSTRHFKKCMHA